jgi:amino acid transporter
MSDTPAIPPADGPVRLKLGTFIGVYTPTVLTILGLMLYLRIGWVVGNAGIVGAIGIVVLANAITLATSLSMSAIATNMRVGVGGAYYLISRTLGLEFGGAVGIPLYLSQTLSITLYAYGLGESMAVIGLPDWLIQVVAVATVAGVTLIAARSTELTLKAQLPVMGFIAISLIALFAGVDWSAPQADTFGTYADPEVSGFWDVFAVFFPAVTGVLAGVSLSGDLKDPRKAIPVGVLLAVGTGFVIYLIVPIALAFTADSATLVADKLIWTRVAFGGPFLIMGGLWGAILSSAFGSILGAPRTLQALAIDGLAPKVLSKNDEKTGEPVLGLRITGGIALAAAILLPNLNAVAEWVTVFFLTTYGALNLVACIEALVGDPSFRPRLRVHWSLSAMGAAGCFLAMFLINPYACIVALVVEGVIFYVLSRRSLQSTWGDVRTGLWLSAARWVLMKLRFARVDPRNWRPHLLVFTSRLGPSLRMVKVADQIGQHRGIVTIMELLPGAHPEPGVLQRRAAENQRVVTNAGLSAFCEVVAVPDLVGGVISVAQANGFAGLQSNTCMFGFTGEGVVGMTASLKLVRVLDGLEKSVIIHRPGAATERRPEPRIIVWWKGREHNGDLMLLLAHLLRAGRDWRTAKIVLKSVVGTVREAEERREEFSLLLPDIRIDAEVEVIVHDGEGAVADVIRQGSREADLVFLGLAVPAEGEDEAYAQTVVDLVDGLPEVLLVHNAGPFRGRLV